MDWKQIGLGFGLAILPFISTFLLTRRKTEAYGFKVGVLCSKILRQKMGKIGEKSIESTIIDFCVGLMKGLKSDNIRQLKKLENKLKNAEKNI